MKIQSLFLVSLLFLLCSNAFAEQAATTEAGAAATGMCKDGTPYTGATKRGACRGHKGVKEWYADKPAPVTAEAAPASATPTRDAATAPVAAATATGLCKDGTEYTGASKRGACRGHKGVKEWYADRAAAAPAPSQAEPARTATPVSDAAPAPAAAATATGLCKDGTEYTGASKRGACRGHKGVKEWYADRQAPAAPETAATPAQAAPAPSAREAVAPATREATPAPAARTAEPASAPAKTAAPVAGGSGKVWVNTRSKIYHCEGSKFYGKTKEGDYMSQADAQAKGFVANRKKLCN
jgi:hypothetical protein